MSGITTIKQDIAKLSDAVKAANAEVAVNGGLALQLAKLAITAASPFDEPDFDGFTLAELCDRAEGDCLRMAREIEALTKCAQVLRNEKNDAKDHAHCVAAVKLAGFDTSTQTLLDIVTTLIHERTPPGVDVSSDSDGVRLTVSGGGVH